MALRILLLTALVACGGNKSAPAPVPTEDPEPVAEPDTPAPAEAEEPEPAPAEDGAEADPSAAATHTISLAFGEKCVDPAEGDPKSPNDVEAALEAAGVKVDKIVPMMTCQACNTCPRLAVTITSTADAAALQQVFPNAKQ